MISKPFAFTMGMVVSIYQLWIESNTSHFKQTLHRSLSSDRETKLNRKHLFSKVCPFKTLCFVKEVTESI